MATTKKSEAPARGAKQTAAASQVSYDKPIEAAKEQVQRAQEQAQNSSATMLNGYKDLASLNRDNIEAVMQSGAIVANGVEALGKELVAFAQHSIQSNIATANAMFGARSLREVIELQNEFARSRFDSVLAESAKLTDLSFKVANEAFAPLRARFNETVEKVVRPVD